MALSGAHLHDPPRFGLVSPECVRMDFERHGRDGVDLPDVVLCFVVGLYVYVNRLARCLIYSLINLISSILPLSHKLTYIHTYIHTYTWAKCRQIKINALDPNIPHSPIWPALISGGKKE